MYNWFGVWEEDCIKYFVLIIFKIIDFFLIKLESVFY